METINISVLGEMVGMYVNGGKWFINGGGIRVIKNSLTKIEITNIMYPTELLGAKAFWGPRLGISQPFLFWRKKC